MKGAIIGDIVGSAYERHHTKSKEFKLFKNRCCFTDDTILTAAVSDALLTARESGSLAEEQLPDLVAEKMHAYGRRHIDRCSGRFFKVWIPYDNPEPYHGYTNGALMRCSSAGWLADSIEEARYLGKLTALPSHDHPDALRAVSLAAEIIFRLRNGASKEDLQEIVSREYDIPTIASLRGTYRYDISCNGTFPVAYAAFLESASFEDTIRTVISLGGDTDTNAAIAGSFAEAFYGVPDDLWEAAKTYCTEDILAVVDRWENFLRMHPANSSIGVKSDENTME